MTPRLKAARSGESKYLGSACKNCGCEQRWTLNATCVQCSNKRAKYQMRKSRAAIKQMLDDARSGGLSNEN